MPLVSIYPIIDETKHGKDVELSDVLDWIRSGEWEEKINKIRSLPDKKAMDKMKPKILPYFCGGGTFSERKESGLKVHSGKLIIDFDKLEDQGFTVPQVKEWLCCDIYSEAVFVSCTGTGIAVITNIDPSRHLESFLYLEKYYLEKYKLKIDKSCKDVSRPRFISFDPDLFIKPNAKKLELPSSSIDTDQEKYDWVLNIHNKKNAYIEGNRHHYLLVLSFFLNKCGVSQEFTLQTLINDFSNAEKTPEEITKIVAYSYEKGVSDFGTYGINKKFKELPQEFANATKKITAFAHEVNHAGRAWTEEDIKHLCAEHLVSMEVARGIFQNVFEKYADEFDLDKKGEIDKVELFLKKRFIIRKNIILGKVEIRTKDGKDANVNDIYRELQKATFKFTFEKLRSLLRSSFIPEHNPFVDYFESLPEWKADKEEDHIAALAEFIKTDNQSFWSTQFKKALVRSIACSIDLIPNRIVMVLVGGEQNTGKTSFIRWLCPPVLRNDYYSEAIMDSTKDSEFQLAENFIWNLDELSSLSRFEITKLKATISKATINQRRAYAENAERASRRVNFWATTNSDGFLTDTSNTRWLCFNIMGIEWAYKTKIDIDRVWAQAYALYHLGFDYTMNKEEFEIQEKSNSKYHVQSMEHDLVLAMYKPCEKGEGEFMLNSEILIEMQKKVGANARVDLRTLGRVLAQLGFFKELKTVNGASVRGWYMAKASTMPGDSFIKYDQEKPF